ncbi:MAG TPA: hypothetical protein VJQ43_04280, partial [Thermoplasmata archaeon]|nr:hypothetical protein [Thermoplasmata archaeon]
VLQVNYSMLDLLTTSTVGSGTISPGPEWAAEGSTVIVTGTPSTGWALASLTSSLPSTALSNGSLSVQVTGPGTAVAQFDLLPPPPPATYNLSVTSSGVPSGVTWNLTLNSSSVSAGTGGSGGTLSFDRLPAGTYEIHASTVYVGTDTRYVPANGGNVSVTLPAVGPVTIAYTTQYTLTIAAGAGGTAGPPTQWANAGTTVVLSETPNATTVFDGWTGTGTGSYSGTEAAPSVTLTGPIREAAAFATPQAPPVRSSSSGSSFPTLGVALLAVLLVVGAVVGLLLGRRGGGGPPEEPVETPSTEEPPSEIYGGSPPFASGEDPAATPEEPA